jgi:hypothetical protein
MVYHHPQQYFSYIEAVSFIGGTKPEDLEKTTDLLQVTDKNVHLALIEIQTHNISGDRHWVFFYSICNYLFLF